MDKSLTDQAKQLDDALALIILSRATNSADPRLASVAADAPLTASRQVKAHAQRLKEALKGLSLTANSTALAAAEEHTLASPTLSEMPRPQVTDEELDQEFNEAVSFLSRATNSGEKRMAALAELAATAERPMAHTFRSLQPLMVARSDNQSTDSMASSAGSSACPTPSTQSDEYRIKLDFLPYDSHNPHPDSTRHRTRTEDHQSEAESQPSSASQRKLSRIGVVLTAQQTAELLESGKKMSGVTAPPSSPRGGLSSSSSRDTSPFNPAPSASNEPPSATNRPRKRHTIKNAHFHETI